MSSKEADPTADSCDSFSLEKQKLIKPVLKLTPRSFYFKDLINNLLFKQFMLDFLFVTS